MKVLRLRSKICTLSMLVNAYIMANQRIEQSTKDMTERCFRYLVEAVGNLEVSEFDYKHAEDFQAWILDSDRNEVTANIYVKTASPVFSWAVRQHLIKNNPFKELQRFRVPKKKIRIFEPYEFAAMLDSCPNKLWQARLLLAKTAGLRRGEALNLRIDDVDFSRQVIYVQPKKETQQTWRWPVKDKDRREVPLVDWLANILADIVLELPDGHSYLVITPERYNTLIERRGNGKLSDRVKKCPDDNWRKEFKRILKRAEIKDGTFHDLRRTCITEWLEGGLHPHEVMQLAGHASVDTTLNYYVTTRRSLISKARLASRDCLIGATGLEPATS